MSESSKKPTLSEIPADELDAVCGGQQQSMPWWGAPSPMPMNPNLTKPPHMGMDAVRQYGGAIQPGQPQGGVGGGGGGKLNPFEKPELLM
jgi:hypothetical protein